MVHHTVEALGRRSHQILLAAVALICWAALLGGCGGSSGSKASTDDLPPVGVGASIRTDDCTDWNRGTVEQRRGTVVQLRQFAGGQVGSSAGIQNGRVLDDDRAYNLLQSYCSHYFARGFKLYKLYVRAAALVGH